jgi:MFS family permease
MAVGSLTGALMAARRVRIRLRLVAGAALLFGAVEIVAGMVPTYLTFVLIVPLLGFSALTMITSANTTMQLATAPHLRGRVMALYLMVFMGGTPIGSPFIGWIGEQFGARWTLIGGGGLTMLGVLTSIAVFTRGRGLLDRRVGVIREPDVQRIESPA